MLNKKKRKFAERYLATGNATQSALEAGYKSRGYGQKLLRDEEIKEYMMTYTSNSKIASAEEVLAFLTSVMRGEEWEIKVSIKKETGEQTFLEEPPTLSQRQKAAELLAKRYRLFSEEPNDDKSGDTFSVNIKVV